MADGPTQSKLPWGGSGFGGTNLPRIGQEVVVDMVQIVRGKSSLTMDKDGNISLQGTKITIEGSDLIKHIAETIHLN